MSTSTTTPEEDAIIRRMWASHKSQQIADVLGPGWTASRVRVRGGQRLGLPRKSSGSAAHVVVIDRFEVLATPAPPRPAPPRRRPLDTRPPEPIKRRSPRAQQPGWEWRPPTSDEIANARRFLEWRSA